MEWDRFWFPFGANFPNDSGFLSDPTRLDHEAGRAGFRLADLDDIPCLILLGPPGIGKTAELNKAAQAARKRGELVDLVSLGRLTAPSALQDQICNSQNATAWANGQPF